MTIPKISENVDSYTINSLSFSEKLLAEGIATALLIIESGIEYNIAVLCGSCKIMVKKLFRKNMFKIRITNAEKKPEIMSTIFSFLIFNSRAPSITIRINPIVPNTGIKESKKYVLLNP